MLARANNEQVDKLNEWILVKGNHKNKTEPIKTSPMSQGVKTVSVETPSPTQVAEKHVWIKSLSKGFLPPPRVKKTRYLRTTTRDASVSKAKLATGKMSVSNGRCRSERPGE